ncbi:MAG TPA: helix-turn-helix domain-containing protein [Thermoanaerobaculia bacterium]|nr:helix-turn-helix domain-containing protein [Thermoanaerobaculia bacterium]
MAEPENQSADERLYTLSEISTRTGISMPTLQRYKKTYQERIPSVGEGRKQRYPESALPVFDELKNENIGRRGRPRKDPNAPRPERPTASKRRPGRPAKKSTVAAKSARGGRKAASTRGVAAAAPAPAAKRRGRPPGRPAKAAAGRPPGRPAKKSAAAGGRGRAAAGGRGQQSGNLMTLTQVSEQTGISYPTLVRYVRMHADRLPSEGKGRARRFYPQAVDVFRQLRSESGRGGRKKGSGAAAKTTGRAAAGGRGRGRAAAASASADTSGLTQRLKSVEKSYAALEKKFKGLVRSLQKFVR